MGASVWEWIAFGGVMAVLLSIDLAVHRGGRASSHRAAVWWSVIWIAVGLAFSVVVAFAEGSNWHEYLAAYAMEKSLSLDNMFVFLLIFRSLKIPEEHQHTALGWGIFGALALRALFIVIGMRALEQWSWVNYVFGGLLVVAAWQALRSSHGSDDEEESAVVRWMSRHLPVSQDSGSNHFFERVDGKRYATPLFTALIAIELSDIAFAIDSVPAALSLTRDRFIVYSSNAFAILGLRSLYLAAHGYLLRLKYLHYGLAAVLLFAAGKLIAGDALELHPLVSVGIIVTCIGAAAVASVWSKAREPEPQGATHQA